MNNYYCKLVTKKGFRIESFYRESNSAIECLKDLRSFEFGDGIWTIRNVVNDSDHASGQS